MAGLVSTEQPLNILLHLDFIHLLVAQKTIQKCELRILIFIQKYVGCECLAYISHIYIYTFNKFSFTRLNFSSNLQLPRKKISKVCLIYMFGGPQGTAKHICNAAGKTCQNMFKKWCSMKSVQYKIWVSDEVQLLFFLVKLMVTWPFLKRK